MVGGLDARARLEQAGIDLNGSAILFSPEQGHDPAIYRAAKEIAASDSKVLSIASGNGAGSINPNGGSDTGA